MEYWMSTAHRQTVWKFSDWLNSERIASSAALAVSELRRIFMWQIFDKHSLDDVPVYDRYQVILLHSSQPLIATNH